MQGKDTASNPRAGFLGAQEEFGPLELLGSTLVLLTAAVHAYLYWVTGAVIFLLATIGFLLGVALLFTRFPRRVLYALGIPYVGVQMLLWVTGGMDFFVLGVFDKTIQALLVGLLLALLLVEVEISTIEELGAIWGDDDDVDERHLDE